MHLQIPCSADKAPCSVDPISEEWSASFFLKHLPNHVFLSIYVSVHHIFVLIASALHLDTQLVARLAQCNVWIEHAAHPMQPFVLNAYSYWQISGKYDEQGFGYAKTYLKQGSCAEGCS